MSWKHQKWSSFVQRFGLLEKTSPERLSSAPLERSPHILLTNPCATKLQGKDSWIYVLHLKKVSNPEWIKHHSNWWPESKDFQEVKQMTTGVNKNTRPGLCTVLSLLPLTLFFLSLFWKYNTLTSISQSTTKGGNISDFWICYQKLWFVHDLGDPSVLLQPISF